MSNFSLKQQYFLAYAVLGSFGPFLALVFKNNGLNEAQIGQVLGASNVAVLLTPVVLTFLADRHVDSRYLMAGVLCISSAAIAALGFAKSFWTTLALLCLHSVSYVAVTPMLDALNFAFQERRSEAGKPPIAYYSIRVWGTIGFILPSIMLFTWIRGGGGLQWALFCAAFFSFAGALCALRLPKAPPAIKTTARYLPTGEALRALGRRPVLIFCLSMLLGNAGVVAFWGFFPLYLTTTVGVAPHWVGPIINIGVVFEIFFMLGFGRLVERFGFKRLMLLGLLSMAARLLLLALFPHPAVVVATQTIHGLSVLATIVAPVMYLNQQSGEGFRNSIQGLYTMTIAGTARIAGSLMAGYLAGENLLLVMFSASLLLTLAAGVLQVGFSEEESQNALEAAPA